MKTKFLLFAFLMVIINACNNQDSPRLMESEQKSAQSHKLTVEQAMARGVPMLTSLEEAQGKTRGQHIRELAQVEYITDKDLTRSGQPDTLFYLVNYRDSAGFLLLTTDDRLQPAYAFSDEGNLDLRDTVSNEGLHIFYERARDAARSIILFPDSVQGVIDNTMMDLHVSPMLPMAQRNVDQGAPYNDYCFTSTGQQAVVGCGAVATEILLSYFKAPSQIGNLSIPWDAINSGQNIDAMARLLAKLGEPAYLNMRYGVSSSGCDRHVVGQVLEQLGLGPQELTTFRPVTAVNALMSHPILVGGFHQSRGGGHIWVVDGFTRYGLTHLQFDENGFPFTALTYFFHCVWGWGGRNNGYYCFHDDGSFHGPADFYDSQDQGTSSSSTSYDRDLEMYYNFTIQ